MAELLLASKVIIQEEQPRVRNIVGVPTNISAFVGVSERGPFGKTQISSFDEYAALFGGITANALDLPAGVEGFFDEAGGAALKCYIGRTVHYSDITNAASKTSALGTITLQTAAVGASSGLVLGTIVGPYVFVPADTLVIDVDGGGDVTATFDAAAAAVTGSNTETFALADGQTLIFAVDGGAPQTATFNTAEFADIGAATADEVAAVINAEITGIQATESGGAVVITSDKKGTGASIGALSGTASAALGFSSGASGTGDVADIGAVTVAEIKTLVEADIPGLTVNDVGGAVQIVSDTTGPSSTITVNATSTADTKIGVDNATHSGAAAGAVDTLRVDGKTDGAYANVVTTEIAAATSGVAEEFNLLVLDGGVLAEVFPNLIMTDTESNYVESIVNDPDSGSDLIAVVDLDAALAAPDDRPASGTFALAGGDDGLGSIDDNDFIGSSISLTGIRAFDQTNDISILAVPGRATSAVHNAMLTYSEVTRAGSMFAVLDSPAAQTAAGIVTYVKTTASLKNSSEFGAIYWPRIKINNPSKLLFGNESTIVVPPSGHICGVYARTDASFGGAGVYEAPAGIEVGRIFAARGVETEEANDENKRDLVFPELINPIVAEDGKPTHIDGARTLKENGDFPTIGERRGIIFISKSLKTGLEFGKHRKIKPKTRAALDRVARRFMLVQTRNGAFASDDPNKAFFLDFTDALNPPTVAFGRKIIGRLGVATAKPAEFIIVRLSQDTRALDAELAEAA